MRVMPALATCAAMSLSFSTTNSGGTARSAPGSSQRRLMHQTSPEPAKIAHCFAYSFTVRWPGVHSPRQVRYDSLMGRNLADKLTDLVQSVHKLPGETQEALLNEILGRVSLGSGVTAMNNVTRSGDAWPTLAALIRRLSPPWAAVPPISCRNGASPHLVVSASYGRDSSKPEGRSTIPVAIESLNILDEVVWFGGPKNVEPTVRRIAQHARHILDADISVPIIMTKSGDVLDGAHRIAKAHLNGVQVLSAVVLDDWPPPDGTIDGTLPNA
jgi:hypothetical protein